MSKKYIVTFNNIEKSLLIGIIFSILFSIVHFQSKCDKISEKVFRLHVIANSNSLEDQELKLKVRNCILEKFNEENLDNLEETKKFAFVNSGLLKDTAQNEVIKNGFDYNVDVCVCNSEFNTRKYSNITLPAGNYDSLKVIIGNGEGKNWWCVLFPPVCLGVSEEHVETLDSFTTSEKKIIENEDEYEIKFKVVEIIQFVHKIFIELMKKIVSCINKFKIGNICSNLQKNKAMQSTQLEN